MYWLVDKNVTGGLQEPNLYFSQEQQLHMHEFSDHGNFVEYNY